MYAWKWNEIFKSHLVSFHFTFETKDIEKQSTNNISIYDFRFIRGIEEKDDDRRVPS